MPRLIIDTDPGIDDAFALCLAARSPQVDLLAVTTVFGNVGLESTTRNALRLLALCGREDVPVAAGAARPLVHAQPSEARAVHGDDGLSGGAERLPQRVRGVEVVPAVELMAQILRDSPTPVTIAAIGPLTNVALLLATHPELAAKIDRLVIMGGGLTGGNVTSAAEFNVWSDPEAAHRVLVEETVPTVLVPIDLTYRCQVSATWLSRLAASGPVGATLESLTSAYRAHYATLMSFDGMVIHDAIALAEAISPGILSTETMPVRVETSFGPGRGATLADRRTTALNDVTVARPVDIALDADTDELLAFIFAGLS